MEGGSLAVAGSDALIPVVNDITANYGDEFALTVFVQACRTPALESRAFDRRYWLSFDPDT